MKTTLDLPEELIRTVKIRAVNEGRRIKDVVEELIRTGLANPSGPQVPRRSRVPLPVIQCAHPALPEEEMTPDRTAAILLHEEAAGPGKPG